MSSSRASSLSHPKSQPHEAEWWKEAAQSFSKNMENNNNKYGSISPPPYVTSPTRYNSFDDGNTNNTNNMSLQDCTAAAATNNDRDSFTDDIFGGDTNNEILQPQGALSDISNDSSDSESDDDYSSYASDESDDSDHSLERPHRTLGLLFFDSVRLAAVSANIRFFNTQMMPVLLAWNTMDILNKCLRFLMGFSSVLLIVLEFPDLFPFLQHDPSQPTPPLYFANWIPRGIIYLFLSLVMFEQQLVVEFIDEKRQASNRSRFFDGIFMLISAAIMFLVGVMYILLGIFCCQKVMERVRREEKERWDEYWEKLKKLEEEEDLEEEREWLLEHGEQGGGGGGGGGESTAAIGFKERWRKWRKRFKRRYRRGRGWWRTIDFKC